VIYRLKNPPTRPVWYSLLVLFVVILSTMVFNVWYTNHVQQVANQRWCALMVGMDDAYRQVPPTTPTGRNVAAEIHRLRRSLGCPL
jgi:hypothetical protein